MTDFIVLIVIVVILIAASMYIIRGRKKGIHCIGCPESGSCTHRCNKKD